MNPPEVCLKQACVWSVLNLSRIAYPPFSPCYDPDSAFQEALAGGRKRAFPPLAVPRTIGT